MACCFFVVYGEKNEHKETRMGYKIRILGQKVQPGIQNLFGNRRIKWKNHIIIILIFVYQRRI